MTEESDVLSLIATMIEGRNNFLTNNTIRGIPYQYRPALLTRFMNNEALYIEFINRVYLNNIQTQAAATALITLTIPNLSSNFMDPVAVTASQHQINGSLENCPTTTSACAICQETLSSGACRIRQCGHVYHRSCILNWFSMSVRCPVCRHDIRQEAPANQTSSASSETSAQWGDQ